MSWSARLLLALVLILAGAAAATWGLARNQRAAQLLGVAKPVVRTVAVPVMAPAPGRQAPRSTMSEADPGVAPRIAELESRLGRVEFATRRAEGSAGRADALVVAFAARRAIERGVPLGFLEPLLIDRFGAQHQAAVGTLVSASRDPVRLTELVAEYEALAPQLRSGGPEEGWWDGFKRELASLVEIRRAERPSTNPDARYQRALDLLRGGEVDAALAETMRLPGADAASAWAAMARRYIAARRALDEIESTALIVGAGNPR